MTQPERLKEALAFSCEGFFMYKVYTRLYTLCTRQTLINIGKT